MHRQLNKPWHFSYWSHTWAEMPLRDRKLMGGILIIHFILTAWYIHYQWIIFDEPDYFAYCAAWLKGRPERIYPIMDSKTPLVVPGLFPSFIKPLLPDRLLEEDMFVYLKAGRYFMYLYQALGIFVMYCWTSKIFPGKRWLIPVLFYCFDPLVFSYGMFIGSDMPSTGLLLTIMYTCWRFTVTDEKRYWWMMCFAVAFAVVLKTSLIYVYFLLLLLFAWNAYAKRRWKFRKAFIQLLQFGLIQLLFINLVYYFKGSFTPFGAISFESTQFAHIQAGLPFLHWLPVPLPAAFLQGIDMLQHHMEIGPGKPDSTYWGVFLFGKLNRDSSLWYYYFAQAAMKMPLLIWLFIILMTTRLLAGKNLVRKLQQHIYLWLPFLYFLLILSFKNKFQIGIRHAMLLLPFLYLALGSTIYWLYNKQKWLFAALSVLHIISVGRYWPNLVAYTNELVWNKTFAYKLNRDSSLDYGQSNLLLKKFLAENKHYKKPTNVPDTGYFAIAVNALFAEQEGEVNNIAWLRNNYEPFDNYMYTILLFHVK